MECSNFECIQITNINIVLFTLSILFLLWLVKTCVQIKFGDIAGRYEVLHAKVVACWVIIMAASLVYQHNGAVKQLFQTGKRNLCTGELRPQILLWKARAKKVVSNKSVNKTTRTKNDRLTNIAWLSTSRLTGGGRKHSALFNVVLCTIVDPLLVLPWLTSAAMSFQPLRFF